MSTKIVFVIFFISTLQLSGCATGGLNDFINKPEKKEISTNKFNITKAYMSEYNDLIICVNGDDWEGNFKPSIKRYITDSDFIKSRNNKIAHLSTKYIIKNESCKSNDEFMSENIDWETISVNNLNNKKIINTINESPSTSPELLNLSKGIYIINNRKNKSLLFVNDENIFLGNQYLYMTIPDKHIEENEKSSALKILYIFSPITIAFDIITFPIQYMRAKLTPH